MINVNTFGSMSEGMSGRPLQIVVDTLCLVFKLIVLVLHDLKYACAVVCVLKLSFIMSDEKYQAKEHGDVEFIATNRTRNAIFEFVVKPNINSL